MSGSLFTASGGQPFDNKPNKKKTRGKAATEQVSEQPAKALLREEKRVLIQCKKASEHISKAHQLMKEVLPKARDIFYYSSGQTKLIFDGHDSIAAEGLYEQFDNFLRELSSTGKEVIIFLSSCQDVLPKEDMVQKLQKATEEAQQTLLLVSNEMLSSVSPLTKPIVITNREQQYSSPDAIKPTSEASTSTDETTSVSTEAGVNPHPAELAPASATITEAPSAAKVPDAPTLSSLEPVAEAMAPYAAAAFQSVSLLTTPRNSVPLAPLADTQIKTPLGLLTLLGIHGVGPQTVEKLSTRYASLGELQETPSYMLKGFVPVHIGLALRDKSAWQHAEDEAKRILDEAEKHHVRLITLWDKEFPPLLKDLIDKPLLLYVKGNLKADCRAVACIGTREPSKFGSEVTRRITNTMVTNGWAIVSGLAIGVDTLAHEAALEAGGYTVAILGNGLDSIYPRKNIQLAERILANGGALLSEQPFGALPAARNLVRRDRLQSGMSLGTIVMQTDILGGSMHTVRYTLTQGRLLFAPVPSGVHRTEPKSQGLLALTENNGPAFAKIINASGTYATLLESKFADRPPAIPLASRENYDDLLAQLQNAYQRKLGNC